MFLILSIMRKIEQEKAFDETEMTCRIVIAQQEIF